MTLKDKIPSIYFNFFPELLDLEFPDEQIATCDNCTLCRSKKSPYFNTKCCTYHPHLANFLLGGILDDNEESLAFGKTRVQGQIVARVGVTPYGIIPSVLYTKRQIIAESQEFWSRPHELVEVQRCPYSHKGLCSIWKYRENLCTTFFCSSNGGAAGKVFWKKVNTYLKMAETSLSQYAMVQLGWKQSEIKTEAVSTDHFNLEDEQGKVIEENYTKLWGEWVDREEEFYKNCFGIIKGLDAHTFKRITGLTREILEAAIRGTQRDFQLKRIPDYLLLHPEIVVHNASVGYTRLVLGEFSVELPSALFPLIRSFNGKRKIVEIFQLGYNILFNLSDLVDELREKGMLIK